MATARRQDIEALRLLSCWGIVSFHVRPAGAAWAYGGLVAFIVLSVWMGGQGRPGPVLPTWQRRARRLLLPWAIWYAVYGGVNLARGGDLLPSGPGLLSTVFVGPSVHLWYLPFIFFSLALLDLVRARVPPRTLAAAAGWLTVLVVAAVPLWRPLSLKLPYPLLQWSDAAAPVLFGVFLAGAASLPRGWLRTIAGLLTAAVLWVCSREWLGPALLLGFAATAALASGALSRHIRLDLRPLSDCTFGIYLAHIGVWLFLLHRGGVPAAVLPEAILLIALALVFVLRRLWPRGASAWS